MEAAARTRLIAQATGLAWDDWVRHLDAQDGRDATHKQIVARARDHMPSRVANPRWWAQTVAVAYTRHIGPRVPGQSQDGTRVGVDIGLRHGRAVLTATHVRLPHAAERERCRVWWRALVDEFAQSLESP